jgi:radical SAM-linked protein
MRLRITFSKDGLLIYTSHLDLMHMWERSLRRARAPLVYSQGFNPRPKLQLAAALPLGHVGEAELLDVWLERSVDIAVFGRGLGPVLPSGLAISDVRQIVVKEPSLPSQVVSAEYVATFETLIGIDIEDRVNRILAAKELPQERVRHGQRRKLYDLRPLIERLWVESIEPGQGTLGMQLAARASATARPEAVMDALDLTGVFVRYHRRCLYLADEPQ